MPQKVDAPVGRTSDTVLLRVFFHPYGNRLILLLAGYDKSRDASRRREDRETARARKYLADFKRNSRGQRVRRSVTKSHSSWSSLPSICAITHR